jgi:hypothetical protein
MPKDEMSNMEIKPIIIRGVLGSGAPPSLYLGKDGMNTAGGTSNGMLSGRKGGSLALFPRG